MWTPMNWIYALYPKSQNHGKTLGGFQSLASSHPIYLYTDSQVYNPNNKVQLDIWVFPKIGVGPPNHPTLIGFSIIFTIHFGGFPPIFGLTPIAPYHQRTSSTICASPPPTQNTHTAKWHGHVLCGQGCQYVQTFSWKTPPNSGACQPWHSLAFLPHQT